MTELASAQELRARIAELEAQLAKQRAEFALAERAGRVGYWRVSLPDLKITCSPGLYAVLGLRESSGNLLVDVAPYLGEFLELPRFMEAAGEAIRAKSAISYRTRLGCPDGTERDIEIFGEIETTAEGRAVAVVGATRDVTEQACAEAERDRLESLYRIMSDYATDIIMIHDAEGIAEFASASLERILGWTLQDVHRHALVALIHPDDLAEVMEMRHRMAQGGVEPTIYRMRGRDGQYIWFETGMSLVLDETSGELRHIVSVMRNINDRKEQDLALKAACEAADAANRSKSAFLANMSHELRTPLNAVIGFSEAMSAEIFGPLGSARYREYSVLIQKSGQHLLDLVNDVLDMAKIEAGKFKLAKEEVDLSALMEECVQTLAERAASSGVQLRASMPVEGLLCTADRRAVKQIALNLISNAIKFTPSGGQVEVTAALEEDVIVLEFRDDGIGIAPEDLERLGQPFEQVCNDPKLAKKGTGLGLALVRALVAQHGGTFAIASPDQHGTIVTVTLPHHPSAEELAA
jgi:cell cycle sensor histidine kinase DivJ